MPDLHTPRLDLRSLVSSDIPEFVAYRRDPDVARYQGWSADYTTADAERLVAEQPDDLEQPDEWLQLAIVERDTGVLCGDCAIRIAADQPRTAELGVTLARSHQGRGIATEAFGVVLEWLFGDLGLHRVYAQADDRNLAVHALFDRLGFRLEARLVDAEWHKDEWTTVRIYARLAAESPATRD